jgi:hypothetical protein
LNLGWESPIRLGPDKGKTVYQMLWEGARNGAGSVLTPSILNTKKYPIEFDTCKILNKSEILNRVGLSPSS